MRKYLPITLILLAALTGQAFGMESQWQGTAAGNLSSLARLAQSESSAGVQTSARIPSLTVLTGGLTLLVWLDSDGPVIVAASLPAPVVGAAAARCPALQPELLPPPQHRMRPPVDRGP